MRTTAAVPVLLLVVSLHAQTPAPQQQVTVGLEHYETLKKASEAPAATVIDTILLAGSFGEKNLTIAFSGRATGTRPLARVMHNASDVTISGCRGNAILSRSGKGVFDLIPLAETFDVRCDLRMSGSDRLRMQTTQAVLAVRSTVADGELITGDEDDSGAREYTLVRHVVGHGETLAATATGRYLITLLPDATRFRYAIDVHNPNRTTSTLELALRSNEHLQQIDSAAPYEVTGGRYVFSIPPGDSTITMSGELRGTSFVAPVRASLQYLVLQSHPLLRPTVNTPAKRISLGETGVTPQYRGALAFETGTEQIAWNVTRLQALHAISYAVNQAAHTLFVPVDGPVLGESTFALRNEGAAELVLPARPEPSYVSFDNEAVLMTKNAANQLTVPLSPGSQNVLVQHRQPLRRVAGFAAGSVAVPHLAVPATNTSLRITWPGQWVPLVEHFASRARIWTPTAGQLLLFFLLAVWIERLLAWLELAAKRRFVAALLLALAAAIVTTFLVLVVVAFGGLTILWIAARPTSSQRVASVAVVGLVAFVAVLAMIGTTAGYKAGAGYESVVTDTVSSDEMTRSKLGAPAPAAEATSYQGLPAKFTLPSGERASLFTQELLRTDRPQTAFVFAVSLTLVNWLGVLIALAGIALLWRERRALKDGIRTRLPNVGTGFSPSVDAPG